MKNRHLFIVLQAVLVTFLWSTSFIIIKNTLPSIPPVTFAGLRYFLASLCMLPIALRPAGRRQFRALNKFQIFKLIILGIIFYSVTQGAQFIGLSLLPSATVSLALNFTPLIVAGLGTLFLKEHPTPIQGMGILFFVAGALIYFFPLSHLGSQLPGLVVMAVGVSANAVSSVLGRNINRKKDLSPLTVTLFSMASGSILLLSSGLIVEGIPDISLRSWFSLGWLALVNTAFAFTLWNRTLQHLTAMESSIINGTMLVQIAVLAWLFLGERLTLLNIIGMILATAGAVLVQLKSKSMSKS